MNKTELREWMNTLLPENEEYVATSSASYKKEIQYFEARLRPLWAILPVYFSGEKLTKKEQRYLEMLIDIFNKNKLPLISTKNRQLAVEAEVLAYGLGCYKKEFLDLFSTIGRQNIIEWLNAFNYIKYPDGNWYFFSLLVNTSLKVNNLPYSSLNLEIARRKIENYYLGNGWYEDGEKGAIDYYNSFVFHFDGILYSKMCGLKDKYSQIYKQRAKKFAQKFQYWFDCKGQAIPFGRSLTYRFAQIAFWSIGIVTDLFKDNFYDQARKIIINNLNKWKSMPEINNNSVLSLGYAYNQELMTEDYNAPGSPMWAFKAFVLLELNDGDSFWKEASKEIHHKSFSVQSAPGFLITNNQIQSIAYSVKQAPRSINFYQGKEKYCKFAYSSLFGFNISRTQLGLDGFAIDSTLAFSLPEHEHYMSKYQTDYYTVYENYALTKWHLWNDVRVLTYLIPLDGNSHIRIHVIKNRIPLTCAEGGFPLLSWHYKYDLYSLNKNKIKLLNQKYYSEIEDILGDRKPGYINQGPNTNILDANKNAVPVLKAQIDIGTHVFICRISAGDKSNSIKGNIRVIVEKDYFAIKYDHKTIKISRHDERRIFK